MVSPKENNGTNKLSSYIPSMKALRVDDVMKILAVSYVVMFSAFMVNTLTCYQQKLIEKHWYIKYIFVFLTIYICVTLQDDSLNIDKMPPNQKFLASLVFFTLFITFIRLDIFVNVLIVVLTFIYYFIELNKSYYFEDINYLERKDPNGTQYGYWITIDFPIKIRLFPINAMDETRLIIVQTIIAYAVALLLVIGLISYAGELKDAMRKKNLTWLGVLFDTKLCKLSDRLPLWKYFKTGLGVPI